MRLSRTPQGETRKEGHTNTSDSNSIAQVWILLEGDSRGIFSLAESGLSPEHLQSIPCQLYSCVLHTRPDCNRCILEV